MRGGSGAAAGCDDVDRAHVTRVMVEGGPAVGVAYRIGGQDSSARAGREVLRAAGAIQTPQLVMLSGIGPADDLRGYGIDVVGCKARVHGVSALRIADASIMQSIPKGNINAWR